MPSIRILVQWNSLRAWHHQISDESICIGEDVPSLTATTVGTAKWYSDDQLQTLIHTGNILKQEKPG